MYVCCLLPLNYSWDLLQTPGNTRKLDVILVADEHNQFLFHPHTNNEKGKILLAVSHEPTPLIIISIYLDVNVVPNVSEKFAYD